MIHQFETAYAPLPHNECIHDKVRRFGVPGGWLYQVKSGKAWLQPVFVPASGDAP